MPLRNRVTPFNDIQPLAARGTLMGNRGCLHNASGLLTNRVCTTRSWVACVLAFKNRQRALLQPGRYTELFFLDEATALAAGHRPCGECRRGDYLRFMSTWRNGNVRSQASRGDIDRQMQADRIDPASRRQRRYACDLASLPDGAMVTLAVEPGVALLVWGDRLLRWSPTGYHSCCRRPEGQRVTALTPRSTVAALAAGYRLTLHPTAIALLEDGAPQ